VTMGLYCMTRDGLGCCMATFIYVLMFVGQFVVFFVWVVPDMQKQYRLENDITDLA